MAEVRIESRARWIAAANVVRWLVLALLLLLAVVAVMLPSYTLAWLRSDYGWFGELMQWLDEASTPTFDMTHVVLFGGIAFLAACLWPRVAWWRIGFLFLLLAVATELVQFWVPGRTPLVGDAWDDLVGVACGLVVALPIRWLLRRLS